MQLFKKKKREIVHFNRFLQHCFFLIIVEYGGQDIYIDTIHHLS